MRDVPHVTDAPQPDFQEPRPCLWERKVSPHFNLCIRTRVSCQSAKLLTQIPPLNYLPGPSANIIPALTQIHGLYSSQLTRVSYFGLLYETWCVTKATLVKSQVGHAGIARPQSDIRLSWLSAKHLSGPSRVSFHGLKYPACCPQGTLGQEAGADVGRSGALEAALWSVRVAGLPHWLWPSHKRGMEETGTRVQGIGKRQRRCI